MQKKPYKIMTLIVLAIYSILIFSFLSLKIGNWFVEKSDNEIVVNSEKEEGESFSDYAKRVTNLVPFRTIKGYITRLKNKDILPIYAFQFFVLNLMAAFPYGLLLPVAFKKLRHFWGTVGCVFVIAAMKEIFKLLITVGRCDIDAIILNVVGGMFGFMIFMLIYKNPSIKEEITD